MCNERHFFYNTIEEEGVGYKFFAIRGKIMTSLINCQNYKTEHRNTISYIGPENEGFCLFLKRPSHKLQKHIIWAFSLGKGELRLLKVRYKGGICEQEESHFLSGEKIRMALVREIEVISKRYSFLEEEKGGEE